MSNASELNLYKTNDIGGVPNCDMQKPGPVLTADGMQEHEIEWIVNTQHCRCGYQYLVRWVRYGPEDNEWVPDKMLKNCEALDQWIEAGGDGQASAQ